MIHYKCCTEVSIDDIYKAFVDGFSDYIIEIKMPKDFFENRFFGPEGNSLQYSFMAFDNERPIGLILGGIKTYEGLKTLRCGTLCIHPEYRGQGISQKLFQLHKDLAIRENCDQLFLEVIVGNDRAIKFYKNLGYEKIYDIKYYSHKEPNSISYKELLETRIEEISFEDVKAINDNIKYVHINWQNDFDYMEKLNNVKYYGAYVEKNLIGTLSIDSNGKIYFIWVHKDFNGKNIALKLIKNANSDIKPKKLSMSFTNSSSIEGFLKHIGFNKDSICQYEMYYTL
ncbi:GNAT family N-acetyltransferase [Clostridium sp. MSJ-4]|uniref:GNAT family N-acetyltransferase n=1 Tax=Clostridium simiarum TaxID=2841506 RepID=A0ABS6F148_9CLOT|nr:GNAT family N-acetyltransferase [Clostridium simiarum]MBU5592234.1 GNAT family N-acetyltransferase [Clostridium simiarum]